mmetsp:Transcript_11865/g.19990  ORF Transcript_11865/g.19990 Transcript_11865/m.19990 type:complete len:559 (+) Transcript_11865:65-1741(+)|eukprot:CAMPEP_0119324062 /NCGR_PEP_ID=MMETSP1333-20130426/62265_1 /TAXON_ID=418940 /ORGANISM="Scyphosphaera apsteinii, Strain RCC1455" /LENGTH=558 /DNA_ID=CAMNT_0007331671 /DNA_START=52 /DNA_END=1728 /DNA_ORIENTATION=+
MADLMCDEPFDDKQESAVPLWSAAPSSSIPQAPEPGMSSRASRKRSSSPTMARRAVVSNWHGHLARTISIDRLPEESKRLNGTRLRRIPSEEGVERRVMHLLLRPRDWSPPTDRSFPLAVDDLMQLCDRVQPLLEGEPTLLSLSAPVKVFGDIHGQYGDLMRIFDQFGAPRKEGGDIQMVDYLFLGDYVDRGRHSLETIVLLLALKLNFPRRIFLVRGNHESPEVNVRDGFLHECVERLGGKQPGVAVWRRLNQLFEWFPIGAMINNIILCVHGGIGRTVTSLDQISSLVRPLRMGGPHAEVLLDLLWSDPTKSDAVRGVHMNDERGSPVVCYGPDRVLSFLQANALKLIVRAHECVMDGFQRFAGGSLITVFSATNYCNRWRNAGAILLVGKDLEIVPKMIFPVEQIEEAWLRPETAEHLQNMRPPTPPREDDDDDDDSDEDEAQPPHEQQQLPLLPPPPTPAQSQAQPQPQAQAQQQQERESEGSPQGKGLVEGDKAMTEDTRGDSGCYVTGVRHEEREAGSSQPSHRVTERSGLGAKDPANVMSAEVRDAAWEET